MIDSGLIYVVTVVNGEFSLEGLPEDRNSDEWRKEFNRRKLRLWHVGYFRTLEDAERSVEHNETDMSEQGYYRYGVISAIPEGICNFGEELQWYEFLWEYPQYSDGGRAVFTEAKKVEKPPQYEQVMFALLG